MCWIDPFTGERIPAPFDWKTTANTRFQNSDHWRKGKTRSLLELRYVKWRHHLNEHFWNDDRYRLFLPDGRWLNPASQQFSATIIREGSVIPAAMIKDIAKALAVIPSAAPDQLAPINILQKLHPDLSAESEGEDHEAFIDSGDFSVGISAPAGNPSDPISDTYQQIRIDSPRRKHETSERTVTEASDRLAAFPDDAVDDRAQTQVDTNTERDQTQDTAADLVPEEEPEEEEEEDTLGFHDEDDDLDRAAQVQQQLLGDIPAIPEVDIALNYEPFHFIGGDFYDFIELKDGRWFVMLGDVSGHGIQAALVVSSIIKTLRFLCQYSESPDLVETMAALNDSVRPDMISGQFFTCFAGILDTRNGVEMDCVCCGHHESTITNPYTDVLMRVVGKKGIGIGLTAGKMVSKTLKVTNFKLEPGDTLWVYTDGVCEAMNPDREEFEQWRTRAACIAHADAPLEMQVDNLIGYVLAFTGGEKQDDLSAMAIRVPHPDDDYSEFEEQMEGPETVDEEIEL